MAMPPSAWPRTSRRSPAAPARPYRTAALRMFTTSWRRRWPPPSVDALTMEPLVTRDANHDPATPPDQAAPRRSGGDAVIAPPLAALHGAVPPRPRWFADALAQEPECLWPVVHGAR